MELSTRASLGRKYLESLDQCRSQDWFGIRSQWESLQIWERLVLIHPDWLRDAGLTPIEIEEVLGPRAFTVGRPGGPCASLRIWGYECAGRSKIEADHLWPYALGGPTAPGNAIALCRDHNYLKGVDIHAYPWEEDPAACSLWLENQVAKVAFALGERG